MADSGVKTWLKQVVPVRLQPITISRGLLARRVADRRVLAGTFQGMHYVDASVSSAYFPKLFGTYERELAPIIKDLCLQNCPRVVDIGAAEGYYAVGIALVCPSAHVIAYEKDEHARRLLKDLSARNGVSARLDIRGRCSADDLAELLQGAPADLVIVDAEGAEAELLDPQKAPELRRSPVLVELHPWIVPDVERTIRDRFSKTHKIEAIRTTARRLADLPFTPFIRTVFGRWLLPFASEQRPEPMTWLHMVPTR